MSILSIKVECITHDGVRFRPSDWIDRIASQFAYYDPLMKRLKYSKFIYPKYMDDGCKVLIIWETDLKKEQPEMYNFIINFIKLTELRTKKIKL